MTKFNALDTMLGEAKEEASSSKYLCLDEKETITIDKDILFFSDNSPGIITGRCKELTIKSNNGSTLSIVTKDIMQPCIGPRTHTGMSYGRWSQAESNRLETIILDGVNLNISSANENFSIGAFNMERYPEVVLLNGASIQGCPEMSGERILVKRAFPPNGSTKINDLPIYKILKDGESEEDLISDELLQLREELKEFGNTAWQDVVYYSIPRNVKAAIELLKLNKDLDVKKLIQNRGNVSKHILECATVLGLQDIVHEEEFLFEISKCEELQTKYSDFVDTSIEALLSRMSKMARGIYNNLEFDSLSDWDKRVVYEMIPAYMFDFTKDKVEDARRFYDLTK